MQLLRTAEVARRLAVHPATVRGWIREGKLPARRIGGKLLFVPDSGIDILMSISGEPTKNTRTILH